jgi:hypothetical protein
MNIQEITKYIIQNFPEILVIIIVSPIHVLMIEGIKRMIPAIKKMKSRIFLCSILSSGFISFTVALAGWIRWKSIPIVCLAVTVLSKVIYGEIVKRFLKVGGDNE